MSLETLAVISVPATEHEMNKIVEFWCSRATLPMRYGRREAVVEVSPQRVDILAVACVSCGAFVRARSVATNLYRLAPRCEDCEREIGGES